MLIVRSYLSLAILSLMLIACGGSGTNERALGFIANRPPVAASPDDIAAGVILNRLDVVLETRASAAQLDAALLSVDGRIITSQADSPFMTVEVPRQADAAALVTLAGILSQQDGIAAAFIAQEAVSRALPAFESVQPAITPVIDYLERSRIPAAWNAAGLTGDCLVNPVKLIIIDKFGSFASLSAEMQANIFKELPNYNLQGMVLDNGEKHGWNVAAIAAADYSPSEMTGTMPFSDCVDLRLFSVSGLSQIQQLYAISSFLHNQSGSAIVNYSLGFKDRCDGGCTLASIADGSALPEFRKITSSYQRTLLTLYWKKLIYDVWDQFLFVTAAGDEGGLAIADQYLGLAFTDYNSPLNMARLDDPVGETQIAIWGGADDPSGGVLQTTETQLSTLRDLEEQLGLTNVPAAKTVIIAGDDTQNPRQSDIFADVKVDASGLPSLEKNRLISGSSFAAPQVAGLSAFLWSLDDINIRGLIDFASMGIAKVAILDVLDTDNTRGISDRLNALRVVLQWDDDTSSTPHVAPVREAMLDLNNDGFFNQDDLTQFANILQFSTAPNPDTTISQLSGYSRFNLNGEALGTAPFDLDIENSISAGKEVLGIVPLTIGASSIDLDENRLSNTQIICYYAYSPVYLGDQATRDTLLPASECGGTPGSISKTFNVVSAATRTFVDCRPSSGLDCAAKSESIHLPAADRTAFQVSGGYVSNVSTAGNLIKASGSNNFASSIDFSPGNGDLLSYSVSTSQLVSANTAYPDNPNFSTITSRAEVNTSFHQETIFTLEAPATYTALVNINMPLPASAATSTVESNGGANGRFVFAKDFNNLASQGVVYQSGIDSGSKTYTGVLAPGDYKIYLDCQMQITLKTVNNTRPAGLTDQTGGGCEVTLTVTLAN